MDSNTQSLPSAHIYPVPSQVLKDHELFILKATMSISNNPELISGKLNEPPTKQLALPSFTIKERLSDNNDSYVSGKGDQNGETKIDKRGYLNGGRHYLFPTFTYPCAENRNSQNLYVLVKDLIKSLNLSADEQEFLAKYPDLYPISAKPDLTDFLVSQKLLTVDGLALRYITARSAFLVFGATILASGSRVIDDYWEQLSKEQGFVAQHRVYALSPKLLELIYSIDPKTRTAQETGSYEPSAAASERFALKQQPQFENPFSTITELPSADARSEFLTNIAHGEQTAIISGQTIHGAIELSTVYKIPKYHYKNSFAAAQQHDVLDAPIGTHTHPVESHNFGRGRKANYVPPEETDVLAQIPGWKFTQLPVTADNSLSTSFSAGGLPVYKKSILPERLKKLTPNQIKDLERSHDVVHLTTALGHVRKLRNTRWTKFWQYKAGAPVGLTEDQALYYKERYLQDVLNHVEVNIVPNEIKDVDEKRTVKRIPNPNFLGHSNISEFRPPFIDKP
ncbi:unnamed protein product [Kluyveromyces dobzhanskii CBS 2104]|uniref:WGS project CCBQ000000000 data, contig 00099 n=1 Tax=Kluyveromyces dobzhanskii CBS 2104 TaxID=1427455 RepID=A0A0A8L1Y4_9SACH|nr:unnamed protein product [Kluyveromyces dobzhanskii CBS 2104]